MVTTLQNGASVEVSVIAPMPVATVLARPEFVGLQQAAVVEGGSLTATGINENASVMVTLALPGISSASRPA